MEIATPEVHAVLSYISAVERQGQGLTSAQVEAFAARERRMFPTGGFMTVAMSGTKILEQLAGTVSVESFTDWLERLEWISAEPTVTLTSLGQAVLRELDQSEVSTDSPLEVTLSPEDPIAYARAIERIAQHEDALLVDAYFRLDDVMPILSQTSVSRVLTSGRGGKKRTGAVAVALEQLPPSRPFEVRVHDDVHDRYVIPGSGPVDSIGTSLGGVGKRFTVMTRHEEPMASTIRATHEALWNAATLLAEQTEAQPPPETPPPPRRRRKAASTRKT